MRHLQVLLILFCGAVCLPRQERSLYACKIKGYFHKTSAILRESSVKSAVACVALCSSEPKCSAATYWTRLKRCVITKGGGSMEANSSADSYSPLFCEGLEIWKQCQTATTGCGGNHHFLRYKGHCYVGSVFGRGSIGWNVQYCNTIGGIVPHLDDQAEATAVYDFVSRLGIQSFMGVQGTCASNLKYMKTGASAVWYQPNNNPSQCYNCMVVTGTVGYINVWCTNSYTYMCELENCY